MTDPVPGAPAIRSTAREVVDGLAVYRRPSVVPPGHEPLGRVVLVHGTMDRAAGLLRAARRLDGLDVVIYDRRGYGRSTGAGLAATIGEAVDDLVTVLAGEPAIVVGHSLGGVIALSAAERHPLLIRAVAAFEAPMPWMPWWPGNASARRTRRDVDAAPADAAESFMRRLVGDERWEQLPAGTRRKRRDEGPALAADVALFGGTSPPYRPEAIGQPVLAGCGSESTEQHRRAAKVLAASVPAGELHVIAGAGHDAPSTHPGAFADYVRRAVSAAPVPSPRCLIDPSSR